MQVSETLNTETLQARRRRQKEIKVSGIPDLYIAEYPSGRRTFIMRYRDPITKKKTSKTLGVAE